MKSKKAFYFILAFFIIINLILFCVNAEEQKKFDPNDARTWEYGSDSQLKTISAQDLFLHYKGYPDVIENLWTKFDEGAKNDFLETQIFKETKLKIASQNLGNKDLKLKDGKLTSPLGAVFDMNNFPKDLTKISYDSKAGFIYEYSDGKKATLDNGGIDREGKTYGTKDSKNDGVLIASGEITISGRKINLNNDKSSVLIDGRTYSFGSSKDLPSFVIVADKGIIGANNIRMASSDAIINVPSKDTYLIFKEGDFSSVKGVGEQYFQLYGKTLHGAGEGTVNILKSFDEVSIKGTIEKGITIYNGETDGFAIKFKGDKTEVSRSFKDAPYNIDYIDNLLDSKRYYSLKQDENGARYLTDNQKTGIFGKAYVSYFGKEQTKENSLMKVPNPATAISASFSLGLEDQENIPPGLTKEEYSAYLASSRDKSVEIKLNELNDYMISKGISKTARDIAGKEFLDNLKTIADTAAEYGFIQPMDQKTFDEKLDKATSENALKILGMMDSAVKDRPIAQFRETSSSLPAIELIDTVLGNDILKANFPQTQTAEDAVASAKGVAYGAATYAQLSDALQSVYDNYGKIPKDTKIKMVEAGDTNYWVISTPEAKIKRGEEWVNVKMDPIKFSVNTNTNKLVMGSILGSSDRLNGWNKYQEKQK
ncbi:Uncharacterised protein [uncultured archaeon]|nr:Uncharacterised protein [uncultured archaeon]